MWVLQARLSFANLDLEQSFALHCSGSCRSKRQSCSATAAISSVWKRSIRLELSRHGLMLFDS